MRLGVTVSSVVLWLALALVPARALAQSSTTGAIQGVITDATSGDALAGVTVVATSEGNATQTAITDEKGAYKITELAPGEYLVTFYYLDITLERPVRVGLQKVTPVYQKLDPSTATGEVVRINR